MYVNAGSLLDFVEGVYKTDNKEKAEKEEKEDDRRLWEAYIHSYPDESFDEWKERLRSQGKKKAKLSMTDYEAERRIEESRTILKGFSL